jgi:hypothetical protein
LGSCCGRWCTGRSRSRASRSVSVTSDHPPLAETETDTRPFLACLLPRPWLSRLWTEADSRALLACLLAAPPRPAPRPQRKCWSRSCRASDPSGARPRRRSCRRSRSCTSGGCLQRSAVSMVGRVCTE